MSPAGGWGFRFEFSSRGFFVGTRLGSESVKHRRNVWAWAWGACLVTAGLVAAQTPEPGEDSPGFAVCFAPGTDPSVVESVTHAGFGRPQGTLAYVFSDFNRWSGAQGDPKILTWSLVPDGVPINIDLGGGCSVNGPSELFSRMDSLFASQGGRATWIARIQQVFDRWSELTGVAYVRLSVPGQDWDDGASFGSSGNGSTRGDIRIAMTSVLGNGCGGILAFNFFPGGGIGGDMVINSDFNWANSANNHRFLRNVVAHEHGHGLGLSHVCPDNNTKLMEPFLSTNFDGPTHDEIRAGQRGYGDPFEPDNSVAQATDLGTLLDGQTIVMGTGGAGESPFPFPDPPVTHGSILSIDANGEQDYFRFSVTEPLDVTITVTPIGLTYDSSTQAFNGSCNSGNFIDSSAVANLNVQLIDTNGSTVLATAASQPVGAPEIIPSFHLPAAGTYFIRVYEGDTPSASQLYELNLSTVLTCGAVSGPISGASMVPTNRYLELLGGNPGAQTAIRGTIVTAPPPFDGLSGATFWLGPPVEVSENAGVTDPSQAAGFPTFLLAPTQCDPFYTDWASLGPVAVTGDFVVPGATYQLQEINIFCDPQLETAYSFPLEVHTSRWGDVTGGCETFPCTPPDDSVDVTIDVTAIVNKFKNLSGSLPKARADLEPGVPDQLINIQDVTVNLDAFRGFSYPFSASAPCP